MAYLAHERDGLQPAEAFLDPLSLFLAQSIPGMLGSAAINGASAASCDVLRHVRHHSHVMEEMDYNLLFRWFVGLNADEGVWDATTFTKNRDQQEFFSSLQARAD